MNRKYVVIVLVLALVLGLGCMDKSKSENKTIEPVTTSTITPVTTESTTTEPIIPINIIGETKNDTKFMELFKESIITLQNYTTKIENAAEENDAQNIKTYSQYLENDAGKYISELEKLNVSSNMTDVYQEYKKRLEYVKTSGERCVMAAERYDSTIEEAKTNLNKCTEYVVEAMKRLNQTREKN